MKVTLRKAPFNALQIFAIAARHGSFQAAANELHVTPGAVSRQIKALESKLGRPLFVRCTRRVELTQAGQMLLDLVLPAVNMIDEAWHQMSGATHSTVLRLECTPTFAMHWLIPRLSSYREQHPKVKVMLRTSQGIVDRNTSSNLVIRRCPSQFSGLVGHPFMEEYSLLVCSPDYLRHQDVSSPAAIASTRLIGIRSRPDLWPKWFAHHGLVPGDDDDHMEFDNTILAIQAATQRLGMAFIPHLFLETFLASGSLIPAPGATPIQTGSYHWLNPGGRLSRGAESFVEWLACAGDMPSIYSVKPTLLASVEI
ncbi:LysR substrate-binding domain-containing protein [Azonexus sp.]|jgi:LysR family glycine cleavage system transcriptional activator|uniref:LysR substrate-binding domain-containing protein n=1 Tax=Azonexus sp. TaxID=1872668 RepID=UPI00282B244B|nr:LysR substrate-binding domain-containing protein [Azonexus sp.]MDR1995195.1 LysR family transcriptional regulator [Azonexus sp.]